MPETVDVKTRKEAAAYRVEIARGSLSEAGERVRSTLGQTCRVSIVSNRKVFGLHGEKLSKTLSDAGFTVGRHLIGDGERFKNLKTLGGVLDALSKFGISRTDAVIGFGGGVVGDIAGFASSIHLRGVNYLQIPTTLLAMVDSSVGGKTAINTQFGKNLAGSFYQPKVVLIDPDVLSTLPRREFTAGFCECVKHGALSGTRLLNSTAAMLESCKSLTSNGLPAGFEAFLADHIAFKAKIVASDERESAVNFGAGSRKVLNFGHTFAHALEKASNYSYLKHGEAVGYGIRFAAELSKKLGLLDEKVVNLLCDVVHRVGRLPSLSALEPKSVVESIRHDKKNISGSVHWVLLNDIGKPVIVPHQQIGDNLVRSTVREFISSN